VNLKTTPMFNATKKAGRVYVERIDLRTVQYAKTDIFRVSIGDSILFDATPEEIRKLVAILQSFPGMYQVDNRLLSRGESMEVDRILRKAAGNAILKECELRFLMDMQARNKRDGFSNKRRRKSKSGSAKFQLCNC